MNNGRKKILKGSAFVYGLVILTAVAIVLTSIIGFVVGQTKYAMRTHAREQAFQIADSGIQFYKWYLAHNTDGRTAQQIQDFWENGDPYGVGNPPYEVEYIDPSGGAVGKYRLEVTPPEQGSTSVTVISTGWSYKYPNDLRVIEVRFRRPSWSEYVVLANSFNRFGSGTETFGKIHSNYGIRFDGVANNLITSAVSGYDDPDHLPNNNEFGVHTHTNPVDPLPPAAVPSRPDVFKGGRQFPVAVVDFNGVLGDLNFIKSVAQAGTDGSLYFDNANNGRHIILRTNDTFSIRTVQSFNSSTNQIINYNGGWQTYNIPNEGVIFVENNVWLEGAVSGKRLTIVAANLLSASKKSLYIGKDIIYTNYDCSDIIGIIGQKDVEIYKGSEENLRIDGALLAQSGRVGRAHYNSPGDLVRDVITVYGAIATNQRYGFAWTDGTGYITRNLYYDNNLLYCPPPYFPVGTQYEMDLWEEK